MTKPTLLVLAAGMGSRYGGLKQIDPVGPAGETIIDYSVFDAIRAGFGKVVFVIRRDLERPFKETVGSRFESRIPVDYVFQELEKLPAGFTAPASRKKPWGTGHAILMAADVVREPFAVINADDFYGQNSFALLAKHLQSGTTDYAMVGFILKNTLSEFGSVARGLCQTDKEGILQQVIELTKIVKDGFGAHNVDPNGNVLALTGEETVSMNMWGFTPELFEQLRSGFSAFLKKNLNDEKAEYYIPVAVNDLVSSDQARVRVLRTPDAWFGVTYREDRPRVVESVKELVTQKLYPSPLWS
jgi:UTP-glucose-1-phosphate uridylyltransferase